MFVCLDVDSDHTHKERPIVSRSVSAFREFRSVSAFREFRAVSAFREFRSVSAFREFELSAGGEMIFFDVCLFGRGFISHTQRTSNCL